MIKLVNVYDGGRIRPGAIEFLYRLMEEREPEVNISHRELPTMEQHRQFVTRRPYRHWYLIAIPRDEDVAEPPPISWSGFISATHSNEIGIVLRKAYRHQGFGSKAVLEFIATHQPLPAEPSVRNGHWLANVAPGNTASRGMFEKLGGRLIQVTYEMPERAEESKQ